MLKRNQPEHFRKTFSILLANYSREIGLLHCLTSKRIELSSIRMHLEGLRNLSNDLHSSAYFKKWSFLFFSPYFWYEQKKINKTIFPLDQLLKNNSTNNTDPRIERSLSHIVEFSQWFFKGNIFLNATKQNIFHKNRCLSSTTEARRRVWKQS